MDADAARLGHVELVLLRSSAMRFTLAAISIRATSEGLRSCGGSTSMSRLWRRRHGDLTPLFVRRQTNAQRRTANLPY